MGSEDAYVEVVVCPAKEMGGGRHPAFLIQGPWAQGNLELGGQQAQRASAGCPHPARGGLGAPLLQPRLRGTP